MTYLYTSAYYHLKPWIPRRAQLAIRRAVISSRLERFREIWPIDEVASRTPLGRNGWPEDKRFALVLTHDIDTAEGQERCLKLVEVEKRFGLRSSFNFVPERYKVDPGLRDHLVEQGFEVGVHDLNHDGKLYSSRKIFEERAIRINKYLREWNCHGFRSGSMHKKLEWIHRLDIEYDSSTYDTDPFEPWSMAVRTIFPFFVMHEPGSGYMELPYTLAQDFTLFVLMREKSIEIWRRKIDWIAENGGMALVITHPDYMSFHSRRLDFDEYPADNYTQLLEYVDSRYKGQFWLALPRDIARYWREDVLGMGSYEPYPCPSKESLV